MHILRDKYGTEPVHLFRVVNWFPSRNLTAFTGLPPPHPMYPIPFPHSATRYKLNAGKLLRAASNSSFYLLSRSPLRKTVSVIRNTLYTIHMIQGKGFKKSTTFQCTCRESNKVDVALNWPYTWAIAGDVASTTLFLLRFMNAIRLHPFPRHSFQVRWTKKS